jgi:hypothetical protein
MPLRTDSLPLSATLLLVGQQGCIPSLRYRPTRRAVDHGSEKSFFRRLGSCGASPMGCILDLCRYIRNLIRFAAPSAALDRIEKSPAIRRG